MILESIMGNSNASERQYKRHVKYLSYTPQDFHNGLIKFKDMVRILSGTTSARDDTRECIYIHLKYHNDHTVRYMSSRIVAAYESEMERHNRNNYSDYSDYSEHSLDTDTE